MKLPSLFACLFLLAAASAPAKVVFRTVDYADDQGAPLQGWLAYDDAVSGPRPSVVVVHDWRGMTEMPRERGAELAKLGYAAFGADIYGKNVRPQAVPEYLKQVGIYKGDRPLFRQRARAAYQAMLRQPEVDPKRTAAIGYCFGGTGVIEMARDGLPLLGVVPFHGGLDAQPLTPGKKMTAKVLALCGADDPYEKPEEMTAFEQQLRDNQIDYQIVSYGHAVHAFTEKDVDAMHQKGAAYNADADRRSWQAMRDFLAEIFGQPAAR